MALPIYTDIGHFEKGRWIKNPFVVNQCISMSIIHECQATDTLRRVVDMLGVKPTEGFDYLVLSCDGKEYALLDILEKTLEKIGNGVK